jgi:hypothetical protein
MRKIANKMGLTLRYKWSTLAMFKGPGLEPVLPSGRLSLKKVYISPGSCSMPALRLRVLGLSLLNYTKEPCMPLFIQPVKIPHLFFCFG